MNVIIRSIPVSLLLSASVVFFAVRIGTQASEVATNATFTKIAVGNIVSDHGNTYSGAWGDYDNDGYLDLFVANRSGQNNFLYHNNRNSNHWLCVKCVGTVSNRAAIGAKVRIEASIAGSERWQLRQISGGDGENNSDSLMVQFGLGDATVVDTVRVEWPSGVIQEFEMIAANQPLTITEPPRLSSVLSATGSGYSMNLIGGAGLRYAIEASTNIVNWGPIIMLTNTSRTTPWADPEAADYRQCFYRAVQLQ
jgi:hypothetical protein